MNSDLEAVIRKHLKPPPDGYRGWKYMGRGYNSGWKQHHMAYSSVEYALAAYRASTACHITYVYGSAIGVNSLIYFVATNDVEPAEPPSTTIENYDPF